MKRLHKIACAVPFLIMGTSYACAQSSMETYPAARPGFTDTTTGRSGIYDKDGFLRENADGAGGAGSGSDGSGNQGRGASER